MSIQIGSYIVGKESLSSLQSEQSTYPIAMAKYQNMKKVYVNMFVWIIAAVVMIITVDPTTADLIRSFSNILYVSDKY